MEAINPGALEIVGTSGTGDGHGSVEVSPGRVRTGSEDGSRAKKSCVYVPH